MRLRQQYLTKNECYIAGRTIKPSFVFTVKQRLNSIKHCDETVVPLYFERVSFFTKHFDCIVHFLSLPACGLFNIRVFSYLLVL